MIGEERRGVWRRTRVTVVGSVPLEASWNKEKQSGSELFHSRFYGPLIAVNAGRTGRSGTGGGIFYFYFHVKLRDTVKDLKLSVFFFLFFLQKIHLLSPEVTVKSSMTTVVLDISGLLFQHAFKE